MKLSSIALLFSGAVLAFSVVAQSGLISHKLARKEARKSLEQVIPRQVAGWTSEELPMGPTELDRTVVSRMLNYDELIYRRFSSDKGSFCLYLGYWASQKMSPSLIGGHTPDRCWVLGGWNCEKALYSWKSRLGGKALLPAQYRLFRNSSGAVQQVVYWHLVGGKPFEGSYRIDGSRSIAAYFKGAILHLSGGNTEQYFIRLSSERPLEEIWEDPGFQAILGPLALLCLEKRAE